MYSIYSFDTLVKIVTILGLTYVIMRWFDMSTFYETTTYIIIRLKYILFLFSVSIHLYINEKYVGIFQNKFLVVAKTLMANGI